MSIRVHSPRSRAVLRIKLLSIAAGMASFLLSVILWFTGHHDQGIFVGIWVPSIFSFGALLLAAESTERPQS